MSKYIIIRANGEQETIESDDRQADFEKMKKEIGCRTIERVQVKYEGKRVHAHLDEEGWLKPNARANEAFKQIVQASSKFPVQDFAGTAIIFMP